jgi:hypothetical protein
MSGDTNNGNGGGLGAGTIAGAAAFVAGGVGTIVAAIGSFGSDDSALAAARRNHVSELIAAASVAALGLMLAGLYGILRDASANASAKPYEGWKAALNPVRAFVAWMRDGGGRRVLAAGVIAVALGVGLGAYATTNRQPGRPMISIERVDADSVRVEISAEGLPSTDWYDALLRGYSDVRGADGVFLASARFSPGQDGKLDWKARVEVPTDEGGKPITRVLVTVARDKPVDLKSCVMNDEDVVVGNATCLSIRVPAAAESGKTQRSG